jgi:replicative DNA helicase
VTILFTTPAELEAERNLVGIGIMWPERLREVDVQPEHFADPRWRICWQALLGLERDRQHIDPLTVAQAIQTMGIAMISHAEIASAYSNVVTGATIGHYAELVRAAATRRALAVLCSEVVEAARGYAPADELLSNVLRDVARLHVEQPSNSERVFDLLKARFIELNELADRRAAGAADVLTGVPTGIDAVDSLVGGFQRGIVTVAAGRPGMGKSSFALACVRNAAGRGIGCHVFSLEDTRQAYVDRVIAGESGVPAESLRTLSLDSKDRGAISWAMGHFRRETPWLVEDRCGITADEVVRTVRRRLPENRTQLVVVDYVQLLRAPRGFRPGEETISYCISVLADAAKQDNIAYLVLAQLNRDCEKRDNKRPLLADLRGAGAIEERAKAVFFLYRPAVYNERDEARNLVDESVLEILVAKNNQGRVGKAIATWDGATMAVR